MDMRAARLAKLAIHVSMDARAKNIYPREREMTWQSGLCLVFASALKQVAGRGELYALAIDAEEGQGPVMSHVVLHAYGRCFDSLGGCSVKTAVKRSDRWLRGRGMKMNSIFIPLRDSVYSGAVDYDSDLLAEVMEKIASERGIDVRNTAEKLSSSR